MTGIINKLGIFVLVMLALVSSGYADVQLINSLDALSNTAVIGYDGTILLNSPVVNSNINAGDSTLHNLYNTSLFKTQGVASYFLTVTGVNTNAAWSIGPMPNFAIPSVGSLNGVSKVCMDLKFNETSSTNYMLSIDNSTSGPGGAKVLIANTTPIISTTGFENECINVPTGYTGNITGLWVFTNKDNTDHRIDYYVDNITFDYIATPVNSTLWNNTCEVTLGTGGVSVCNMTSTPLVFNTNDYVSVAGVGAVSNLTMNVTYLGTSLDGYILAFERINITLNASNGAPAPKSADTRLFIGARNPNNLSDVKFFSSVVGNPTVNISQITTGTSTINYLINANLSIFQNTSNPNLLYLYNNTQKLFELDISSWNRQWVPVMKMKVDTFRDAHGAIVIKSNQAVLYPNPYFVLPTNNCTSFAGYFACSGNITNTTISTSQDLYLYNVAITTTNLLFYNTTGNLYINNSVIRSIGNNGGTGSSQSVGGCNDAAGGTGGTGGNGNVTLLSSGLIYSSLSNITSTGGVGGNGGGADCLCSTEYFECNAAGGQGGDGGYGFLDIKSLSNNVNLTDSTVIVNGATGGNGGDGISTCNNAPGQTCTSQGGNGGNGNYNFINVFTPTKFSFINKLITSSNGGGGGGGFGGCNGGCGASPNGNSGSSSSQKIFINSPDILFKNTFLTFNSNGMNLIGNGNRTIFENTNLSTSTTTNNNITFTGMNNFLKLDTSFIPNQKYKVLCPAGSNLTVLAQNSDLSQLNFTYCQGTVTYINGVTFNSQSSIPNESMFNTNPNQANISVFSFYDPLTCQLYVNNTLQSTQVISSSGNIDLSFNITTPAEGRFPYFFRCSNIAQSLDSENRTIIYDTVSPIITTDFTDEVIFGTGSPLTGTFNFVDLFYLYSYNISIDGNQVVYNNTINSNATTYYLNENVDSLTPGEHRLGVRVADGHTAIELTDDYEINKGWFGDILEFEYSKGRTRIYENGGSWDSEFIENKQLDRYTFNFTPGVVKDQYTFIVDSYDKIEIINAPDTYLGKWLIIGDKWVDFYMPNDNPTVVYQQLTDKKVAVTISQLYDPTHLEFQSFGELNIVEQNYSFFTFNVTTQFTTPLATNSASSSIFTVYKGTNFWNVSGLTHRFSDNSMIASINLTEKNDFFNFERYTAFFTTPAEPLAGNKTAIWNFTTTQSAIQYSVNYSQIVIPVGISNCSNASWAKALTFTFADESNLSNTNITSTLNVNVELRLPGSQATVANVSVPFKGGINYSICISPNDLQYDVNAILEYFATGYSNRKYYLNNVRISNNTQYVTLYHLATSLATNIQMKVYDKVKGTPVTGAYVQILRYYPELGAYRTVEIGRTDENGFAIGKMVLYDIFYKFNVYYQGTLRLNTEVQTIYTGTKLLPILISEDPLRSAQYITSVYTSHTCDLPTATCQFTWADSSNIVRTARFEVYRVNGFGRHLLYENSQSSPAGTLFYLVTENMTGNRYESNAWIDSATENSWFFLGIAEMAEGKDLSAWGGIETIIYGMMLLVIVAGFAFIDIGPAGLLGGTMAALAFGSFLGWVPLAIPAIITLIVIGGFIIVRTKT